MDKIDYGELNENSLKNEIPKSLYQHSSIALYCNIKYYTAMLSKSLYQIIVTLYYTASLIVRHSNYNTYLFYY